MKNKLLKAIFSHIYVIENNQNSYLTKCEKREKTYRSIYIFENLYQFLR